MEAGVAIPIFFTPSLLGVLYADSRRGERPFDDEDVDTLEAIASHLGAALQTARGVVRLCPKVQNLYSKMATSFNSYPNRPLSSDLFYMTDETYNEERALVSLWQSFQLFR